MLQKIFRRPLWLILSGLVLIAIVPVLLLLPLRMSGSGHGPDLGTRLAVGPNPSSPGSTIMVSGFEYPATTNVQVYFQSRTNGVVSTVTTSSGFFTVPLTLPKTYFGGVVYVYAISNTYSGKLPFTIARPSLVSLPGSTSSSGLAELSDTPAISSFSGNGFIANEVVNLTFADGTLGVSHAGTVTADTRGHFSFQLTLPDMPADASATLTATGTISHLSVSAAVPNQPTIHINPTSGSVGTRVVITGSGFGAREAISVSLQGRPVIRARTDRTGRFFATFKVPNSATISPSQGDLQAVGQRSRASAVTSFQVLPFVTLRPNHGKPGRTITVIGSQFTPGGSVQFFLEETQQGSSSVGTPLGGVQTSAQGTLQSQFIVPQGLVRHKIYFILFVDVASGVSIEVRFRVD